MNFLSIALWISSALASAPSQDAQYKVGPGDVIEITVFTEETLSGEYVVGADGTYTFPYIGEVNVEGHSPFEAEEQLREMLSPDYLLNPQVRLKVKEFRSRRVEVFGAVNREGNYFLERSTTLREILARAGGLNPERSAHRVVVNRGGEEHTVIGITEYDGPKGNILLEPGDVVTVDEGEVVFISGEVKNPGAINFYEGLTVTQALSRVGGPTQVARLAGAYILRSGSKERVHIRKILRGKKDDPRLFAGDQLFLPESAL